MAAPLDAIVRRRHAGRRLTPIPSLVWCGNYHLAKHAIDGWRAMGSQLRDRTGIAPFAIDQTPTVSFDEARLPLAAPWSQAFGDRLDEMGGTAGFLTEEAPSDWAYGDLADAYLLSTDNRLS